MARSRNGIAAAQPRRERSEEVYSAALRLFNAKGYHATSMQDIAAAVGLYKGSLYHYIASKDDLLVRVFERAMASLLAEAERIVGDPSLRPADQLRLLVRAHVRAVADNLDALTVYLHEFRALTRNALEEVRIQRERYRELVSAIVARGAQSGEFVTPDVDIATLGILGMCNWLAQWYQPSGRLGPEAIAEQFADILIQGLGRPYFLDPSTSSPTVSPNERINVEE